MGLTEGNRRWEGDKCNIFDILPPLMTTETADFVATVYHTVYHKNVKLPSQRSFIVKSSW